ncbi:MAG: hypothetical protein ACJAWK_000966 [Candidatus Azotimanducaceae bacterium]|jgi:hypothetical protein
MERDGIDQVVELIRMSSALDCRSRLANPVCYAGLVMRGQLLVLQKMLKHHCEVSAFCCQKWFCLV